MRQFLIQFIFIICFSVCSYAGDLIDCPDCGKPVSERAVMCPQCGCPASGIIEAVELKHAAEKLLAPRSVVRVKADDASGYGVIVAEDNKSYVMMDASLMDATVSLSITLLATNRTVRYQNFQVAQNEQFARFIARSIDVVPVAILKEMTMAIEEYPIWLTPDIYSDCVYTGTVTISDNMELPNKDMGIELVALADGQTNLAALVCNVDSKKVLLPVAGEVEWVNVSLSVYRNQTRLLVEAEKLAKEGALQQDIVEKLKKSRWATEFLKKRAGKLLIVSD